MKNYPFTHFGGNGSLLHLGSANGFHPKAYKQLVEELTDDFEVLSMHFRPLWENSDPYQMTNWKDLVVEFIDFLEQQKQPIIGVGHSFGASLTILAAYERPDLFQKLILIEPVLLPKFVFIFQKLVPLGIRKKVTPIAKTALNRTDVWENKQAAYDYLRPKRVFKRIPDDVFTALIDHTIETRPDGKATLSFTKQWEAQIYATVGNIWPVLPNLKMPVLALRGAKTDTIRAKEWEKWQKLNKITEFKNVEGLGHLLPFEDPKLIASFIKDFTSTISTV